MLFSVILGRINGETLTDFCLLLSEPRFSVRAIPLDLERMAKFSPKLTLCHFRQFPGWNCFPVLLRLPIRILFCNAQNIKVMISSISKIFFEFLFFKYVYLNYLLSQANRGCQSTHPGKTTVYLFIYNTLLIHGAWTWNKNGIEFF